MLISHVLSQNWPSLSPSEGSAWAKGRECRRRDHSALTATRTLSPLLFKPLPIPFLLPSPLPLSSHLFLALPAPSLSAPSISRRLPPPSIPSSPFFSSDPFKPFNLTFSCFEPLLRFAFYVRCSSAPSQTRYFLNRRNTVLILVIFAIITPVTNATNIISITSSIPRNPPCSILPLKKEEKNHRHKLPSLSIPYFHLFL